MWWQVRQLKKARRLSGAVLATLRKRRRSDSAASSSDLDSLPWDNGTAGAGGDSEGESGGCRRWPPTGWRPSTEAAPACPSLPQRDQCCSLFFSGKAMLGDELACFRQKQLQLVPACCSGCISPRCFTAWKMFDTEAYDLMFKTIIRLLGRHCQVEVSHNNISDIYVEVFFVL